MKEKVNKANLDLEDYEIGSACGNCWGHQEYQDGYEEKTLDTRRNKKDNFISRFVKKYLPKS